MTGCRFLGLYEREIRRSKKERRTADAARRFGDPAGIRTPDTLLKRQVLCLLSYWVILKSMYLVPPYSFKTCSFERKGASLRGGGFRLPTQAEAGTGRGVATWLGWQDSNLQYQSQSLVCYRYTTSHHRLRQRGRHCRPPAFWGGRWGSNPRHPEPQSGAHTN